MHLTRHRNQHQKNASVLRVVCSYLGVVLVAAFWVSGSRVWAEDNFPPRPYPIERYLDGWAKNPFTLKTAPVVVTMESFAKDLVLGSVSQIGDVATVTMINTKTRERTRLISGQERGGMKIKSVHLGYSRKEISVELESGTETAVLHYDNAVLKQLAEQKNLADGNAQGKLASQNLAATGSSSNAGYVAPPLPPPPTSANRRLLAIPTLPPPTR